MLGCAMSIRLPASTCLVFLILLSAGPTWSLPHASQTPLASPRMEYAGVSPLSSSKFTERLRSGESLRGGSVPDASTRELSEHPDRPHRIAHFVRRLLRQEVEIKRKPLNSVPRPLSRSISFYVPASTMAILSVLCYIASSLGMTLINKHIFKVFSLPLTVTGFQLIVSLILLWVLGVAGQYFDFFSFAPPPEFDVQVAFRVVPLTSLYIAMLSTTNYCLKCVDISFYQVLRSLVIPINLFIAYVRFGNVPKTSIIISCLTVMMGFILGTTTELNFTTHGFVAGCISSFFVAMYSITVKQSLPIVGGSTWRLMQYTTSLSILMLLPAILLSGEAATAIASEYLYLPKFWGYMSAAGVLGFSINIFFFLLIKFASPLSTHISGCVKSALQTILSVLIFGNTVVPVNALGIFLTLAGSAMYSLDRYMFPEKV